MSPCSPLGDLDLDYCFEWCGSGLRCNRRPFSRMLFFVWISLDFVGFLLRRVASFESSLTFCLAKRKVDYVVGRKGNRDRMTN